MLIYPFQNGMPPIPKAPIRKARFKNGFFRPNPRISFRFSWCVFINTTPAAMNNTSLIREWFIMCRKVPCTASPFSSPSRHCIPVPTRITPIWDMDEHARVRFKSTEKTASTAPPNMVTTPRARIRLPHFSSP